MKAPNNVHDTLCFDKTISGKSVHACIVAKCTVHVYSESVHWVDSVYLSQFLSVCLQHVLTQQHLNAEGWRLLVKGVLLKILNIFLSRNQWFLLHLYPLKSRNLSRPKQFYCKKNPQAHFLFGRPIFCRSQLLLRKSYIY